MTLTELHVALKQAGIESAIVDEVAEAMVRDGHSAGFTDMMTSGQVAKFLWLSFISHDPAVAATESLLLLEGHKLLHGRHGSRCPLPTPPQLCC